MKLQDKQLIMNLKGYLFDLFEVNGGLFNYEILLENVLVIIKDFIEAEEVTLYKCDLRKQHLFVEASTISHKKNMQLDVSCENYEQLLSEEAIIISSSKHPFFSHYDLLLQVKTNEIMHGYMGISGVKCGSCSQETVKEIVKECAIFLSKANSICGVVSEEKRYKQLFRVTEKFHSTMDMDLVLGEIIDTLQEVYPTFTYYLMLSHDNNNHQNLPIKDLEYDSNNTAAMQAYLTGMIQFEDSVLDKRSILYAPLIGKQGVYGVLQVIAPNTMMFPQSEVEFMQLLANTAGSALENAKLYQQSRKLIADLQLINNTSHQLNSNLRLADLTLFMKNQIIDSFDAEEVGFVLIDDETEKLKVLKGSTEFFSTSYAEQYLEHIHDRILLEKEPLFIGEMNLEDEGTKFKSIMAVPMVDSEVIKGFAMIMHQEPYHFTFETFKLVQSLIRHSTLAISNSILREQLEKMATTDQLTKLYSRRYLHDRMDHSMTKDAQGSFIFIDIDNFKQINDTFGHQVGDEVLVQVATIIQSSIRDSDIGGRWGGEELAIYLPSVPLQTAVTIAERLVETVRKETTPPITISCGVSHWMRDIDDSYARLFKRADEALYIAKETGKNKVVVQE